LFASISARKLHHSDVTIILSWYQTSVKNEKKTFSRKSKILGRSIVFFVAVEFLCIGPIPTGKYISTAYKCSTITSNRTKLSNSIDES